MLLWTLVYKFLFEHPYGPLNEEPPNYFPQKFHCLYLFLSFVSPIKTNIHSRCACSKIPVSLWVSFMSAHPEILGDISCEQSTWSSSTSSPHGATHPESPLPTAPLQRQLSIPATTACMGTCRWREDWHLPGMQWEVSLSPIGKDIMDVRRLCGVPSLMPLFLEERVPPMCFSRGAMRRWWPENLVACRRGRVHSWQGWGPDPAFQLSAWRQDWCFGDGSVRVLTLIRNKDLGTNRLFGRWSQETPIGGATFEDAWGSVPAWTLWETVSSHWQVKKLGCSSLKSYPHRLIQCFLPAHVSLYSLIVSSVPFILLLSSSTEFFFYFSYYIV